jgi:hypothetical protein
MSDWHWPKKILLMLLEPQSLHTRPCWWHFWRWGWTWRKISMF